MEDFALKQQILQLIVAGFFGSSINANSSINKYVRSNLGGVILTNKHKNFSYGNIQSKAQTKALCSELNSIAKRPLFIATDIHKNEENTFNLCKSFDTYIPSLRSIGEDSLLNSYYEGAKIACFLSSLGINFNLSNSISLQSNINNEDESKFSHKITENIGFLSNYIKGQLHYCNNFTVCLSDCLNPKSVVNYNASLDILNKLINVHKIKIKAIKISADLFISHNLNYVINDLIRNNFGYDGLIIAEDFETSNAYNHMSLSDYVIKGINCGVNMFIISNTLQTNLNQLDVLVDDLVGAIYSNKLNDHMLKKSLYMVNAYKSLYLDNSSEVA